MVEYKIGLDENRVGSMHASKMEQAKDGMRPCGIISRGKLGSSLSNIIPLTSSMPKVLFVRISFGLKKMSREVLLVTREGEYVQSLTSRYLPNFNPPSEDRAILIVIKALTLESLGSKLD